MLVRDDWADQVCDDHHEFLKPSPLSATATDTLDRVAPIDEFQRTG